jgi:hypothetical protein
MVGLGRGHIGEHAMGSGDVGTAGADGVEVHQPAPRYILITECLQNDFFRSRESRLCLPAHVVRPMFYAKQALEENPESSDGPRAEAETVGAADDRRLRDGPLDAFFQAAMGARRSAARNQLEHLHVINVRDWHVAGAEYDVERRTYGSHCERGSRGAEYIAGFEQWLDPAGAEHRYPGGEARDHHDHKLSVYHVHSGSLFDFKPRVSRSDGQARLLPSELQMLLDVVIQGEDDDVQQLQRVAAATTLEDRLEGLTKLADGLTMDYVERPLYIAVIGVYTDIKIQIVLGGIRTRYNVVNLAVSDTFTASPSLERHLAGLDFSSKVLNVEIVHGVDSLVRFLGGGAETSSEDIVSSAPFAIYQNYLRDKQEVLGYQTEKVREYAFMTERRSASVYVTVKRANQFLLIWGSTFLVLTLVLVIRQRDRSRARRLEGSAGHRRYRDRPARLAVLQGADGESSGEPDESRDPADDPGEPQPQDGIHTVLPHQSSSASRDRHGVGGGASDATDRRSPSRPGCD